MTLTFVMLNLSFLVVMQWCISAWQKHHWHTKTPIWGDWKIGKEKDCNVHAALILQHCISNEAASNDGHAKPQNLSICCVTQHMCVVCLFLSCDRTRSHQPWCSKQKLRQILCDFSYKYIIVVYNWQLDYCCSLSRLPSREGKRSFEESVFHGPTSY